MTEKQWHENGQLKSVTDEEVDKTINNLSHISYTDLHS